MTRTSNTLWKCFLACAIFFSLQIIPRWWSDSIVMDEEWELTASYYYLKTGDVWTPWGNTAPGALCALPLLGMNLKLDPTLPPVYVDRSLRFLFMDNHDHLTAMTFWSRNINWLLGLLIGFLLFRTVRDGPLVEGAAALVLWAFEPNLLAFTGTAKTDIAVVFWFFLCLFYFSRIQPKGRILPFFISGLLAGLAAATRYNGMLVLPSILVLEILFCRETEGGRKKWAGRVPLWLSGLLGFLVSVSLVYLPGTILVASHPWPLHFYLHYLQIYADIQPDISSHPIFFAGRFWPNGSYLNFPYHFFFKNTVPFFCLVGLAVAAVLRRKISLPPCLWVPPLVYLAVFYFLDKSMLIRHALPIYPFLILISARVFQRLWETLRSHSSAIVKAFPILLLAWHPLTTICNFPHHIAYANDFMTTEQKTSCLYIYDWNLGQDMKRLAETALQKDWKKVKFISGMRTDPYFYGLSWEPWTQRDLSWPQPGTVYVLSPTILGSFNYDFLFFKKSPWVGRLRPTGNVGGTIYYYEIPGTSIAPAKDNSAIINSFPYYPNAIPPYRSFSFSGYHLNR